MSIPNPSNEQLQIEIDSLRQRLAEMEQRAQMFEEVTKHLPFSLTICHLEHLDDPTSLQFAGMYEGTLPSAGGDMSGDIGKKFLEVFPNVTRELLETYAQVIESTKKSGVTRLRASLCLVSGLARSLDTRYGTCSPNPR